MSKGKGIYKGMLRKWTLRQKIQIRENNQILSQRTRVIQVQISQMKFLKYTPILKFRICKK